MTRLWLYMWAVLHISPKSVYGHTVAVATGFHLLLIMQVVMLKFP